MFAFASLTCLALGSWTYADFVADPRRPAAAIEPPPKVIPTAAILPPTRPVARPTPTPPASVPIRPQPRYHLADVSGQVWEHTDPNWLQTYVQQRNQQFLFAVPARSVCTTGCR